jgi:hypothetical protein
VLRFVHIIIDPFNIIAYLSTIKRFIWEADMKKRVFFMVFGALSIWVFSAALVTAGWQDILKGAQNDLGTSDSISESEIVEGLKEALEIGTGKAVELVSKKGGYYGNPEIKVPLPGTVQKAETFLRTGPTHGFRKLSNRLSKRPWVRSASHEPSRI